MTKKTNQTKKVAIVRITPPILEKGLIWFENNNTKIKKEATKFTSFWYANYKEIEKDQKISMSEFMRSLAEWGYVRVVKVSNPGEFAHRGGIIDVFPINSPHAFRIEFGSNMISGIFPMLKIKNDEPEKKLKDLVAREADISKKKEKKEKELQKHVASLEPGTYVVHIDHGIAHFKGIEKNDPTNQNLDSDDLLVLEYAQDDKLFVPIKVAYKVEPYIGFGEPKPTRLGGNIWEKTKRKVKEDLIKTAKKLAAIYAEREVTTRNSYRIDEEVSHLIEKDFEHVETPDQLNAINDVKKDLSRPIPMDRVICGDVGFGKTEVALRASAYAISAGYQVALIAPTTVLAHQHFKTFTERFNKNSYPIRIEKLTRIEKPAKQREVLKALKNKKCDIVIGTHKLLQKNVEFANLGMLIIDEEQRFGVKQKEKLKEKYPALDVLSLSATPIPRTLHFALSGLRDMSVIDTPPYGRTPIKTVVKEHNRDTIKKAIENELSRNGQVFYLHNRILSLKKTVEILKELVPSAKIDFMHAKLSESDLIHAMESFREGKIDVLVTTTIMENGLDLKNANTLIVDDATRLGLAQAHQIRGRVGRGDKQAFAYFLHPNREVPEKARERLEALKESDYLGAGYNIAMRDLELRGAGNLLGKEQSGSIAKVGFNLYCQLLNEAIEELNSS
ncbi:MAG: DEAD/DEAH box helicase [Candidatus Spechtbacterales bacterium]|nr:DEAD/DEAH box helicase [Candidatus Spechtbacterales bacterium]